MLLVETIYEDIIIRQHRYKRYDMKPLTRRSAIGLILAAPAPLIFSACESEGIPGANSYKVLPDRVSVEASPFSSNERSVGQALQSYLSTELLKLGPRLSSAPAAKIQARVLDVTLEKETIISEEDDTETTTVSLVAFAEVVMTSLSSGDVLARFQETDSVSTFGFLVSERNLLNRLGQSLASDIAFSIYGTTHT